MSSQGITIQALYAVYEQGGWVNRAMLAQMLNIKPGQASDALLRLSRRADEWCGEGGWEEQVKSSQAGGRWVRIHQLTNPPAKGTKSKIQQVRDLVSAEPEITSSEVARRLGFTKPNAQQLMSELRRKNKPGYVKKEQSLHDCPIDRKAAAVNRKFREMWPRAGA